MGLHAHIHIHPNTYIHMHGGGGGARTHTGLLIKGRYLRVFNVAIQYHNQNQLRVGLISTIVPHHSPSLKKVRARTQGRN